MPVTQQVRQLPANRIDDDAFRPFGRVLRAMPDGTPATDAERQLDLSCGEPRFYLMELAGKPATFRSITRHRRTTQSLLAVCGGDWFLAVAPPSPLEIAEAVPDLDQIVAFAIPVEVSVLLHRGTWHAGPFFTESSRVFANLELTDTNVVDHHTVPLSPDGELRFEITVE
jgi:ureidoglycolate hydrolase